MTCPRRRTASTGRMDSSWYTASPTEAASTTSNWSNSTSPTYDKDRRRCRHRILQPRALAAGTMELPRRTRHREAGRVRRRRRRSQPPLPRRCRPMCRLFCLGTRIVQRQITKSTQKGSEVGPRLRDLQKEPGGVNHTTLKRIYLEN